MALTDEEQRALNFNLSRKRQAEYCKVRMAHLKGNDGAKKQLTDRMIAVTKGESNEQRNKIKYDERNDREGCGKPIVN